MADTRKTLIYCRESRDDYGENYDRIEVQRDILEQFCQKMNLVNIVDVIMDDNVSGTMFLRFQPIIERIKRGEIEVIVFKDASRLGRNLRESLNFVALLEEYGVEILFESEEYDEDFFPLKAWFNEQRAKEDSKKIRRVIRHKMESGELVVKPVYGYTKAEDTLLPHPQHSEVVKKIFKMTLDGLGTNQIAAELNRLGLPTPSQASGTKRQAAVWNRQHIWRIINNDTYIGTMTYHKRTNVSYKNKKLIYLQPDEWIVKENHHPAIISKEEFSQVQEMVRHAVRTRPNKKRNRPFTGLLQCGRCGSSLVLRMKANRSDAYICGKNNREGAVKDHIRPEYGCRTHHIQEKYLYDIVAAYVKNLLYDEADYAEKVMKQCENSRGYMDSGAEYRRKIEDISRIINKIYDDKLNGLISEELFQSKYNEYRQKRANFEKLLCEVQNKTSKKEQTRAVTLSDIIQAVEEQALTAGTVKKLFEKIIYYLPGEITIEDKLAYSLPDDYYNVLFTQGGLLFFENIADSGTM